MKTGPAKPPATMVPPLVEMAFSTPSDAGRSRNESSGDAGELAALGLAPGWGPEADGSGSPVVEVAELPPRGEAEVAQAAASAAIAIKCTNCRIMARCRGPKTAVTPLIGRLELLTIVTTRSARCPPGPTNLGRLTSDAERDDHDRPRPTGGVLAAASGPGVATDDPIPPPLEPGRRQGAPRPGCADEPLVARGAVRQRPRPDDVPDPVSRRSGRVRVRPLRSRADPAVERWLVGHGDAAPDVGRGLLWRGARSPATGRHRRPNPARPQRGGRRHSLR